MMTVPRFKMILFVVTLSEMEKNTAQVSGMSICLKLKYRSNPVLIDPFKSDKVKFPNLDNW